MTDEPDSGKPQPAGDFGSWLFGMRAALEGERASEVPCGDCTACCTSSQFVHVGPDETGTLDHIPNDLLFPAPGLPAGHFLMGYDEQGRCPMLQGGACSIYAHRPRTCRTYDCRIFPATGLDPADDGKDAIAHRARRWRFTYASDDDRVRHSAVREAAAFLRAHPECFPGGRAPTTVTQLAVVAVEVHDAFLHLAAGGETSVQAPDADSVKAALQRVAR